MLIFLIHYFFFFKRLRLILKERVVKLSHNHRRCGCGSRSALPAFFKIFGCGKQSPKKKFHMVMLATEATVVSPILFASSASCTCSKGLPRRQLPYPFYS